MTPPPSYRPLTRTQADWEIAPRRGLEPPRRRRRWLLPTLLVTLSAAVTGGLTYGYYRYLPPDRSLPGTYVAGKLQPEHRDLGAWLEERRAALRDQTVLLNLDHQVFEARLGSLGVELDVAATLAATREHASRGGLGARIHRSLAARRGEEVVEAVWQVDEERLRAALTALAPEVQIDPVDARLDLEHKQKIHDEPGQVLDLEASVQAISSGPFEADALLPLKVSAVPARVTVDMLADVDVTQVLGSFETSFAGTGEGRAVNIRTGASYLNGTVLAPGQVLSFNERVGERSLSRGFTWAPVILDDELTPGIGGGICQVASTLHAASVYAGVSVTDRRSHSRPIGYTPLGLDAVVVWGHVDLKIRNDYDTPIIIHAFIPTPGVLKVELLGRAAPKVEYKYGVARVYDFYRRITTKPWLEERRVLKQRGRKGYDVFSIVKVTHPNGRVEERSYSSVYRPVPEVFWVGPSFDVDQLPEVPEGVRSVQLDGRELPAELFGADPYAGSSG
ncbi:MAG: VanW family protein [Polyangiaceae bacterium]|nr:VanW family protein [Polyangiaceae bacterium]MCW5791439.1 VanW family protein [Polyangiaceae bacterium]